MKKHLFSSFQQLKACLFAQLMVGITIHSLCVSSRSEAKQFIQFTQLQLDGAADGLLAPVPLRQPSFSNLILCYLALLPSSFLSPTTTLSASLHLIFALLIHRCPLLSDSWPLSLIPYSNPIPPSPFSRVLSV